jgi:hypothetical protein
VATFNDHDIGRCIQFDVGGNCTPWLRIYSGGFYGFQSPGWVDRPIGGEWSSEPGTCEVIPFRGWGPNGSNLYILACKGLGTDELWGIVIDWNGHVVAEWARGWGSYSPIGTRPPARAHVATPADMQPKTHAEPRLSWEEYEQEIERHGAGEEGS